MAGIEAPEYQVNVSQENLINKFAVQGEENSRVLTLHLVETVQTVTALEETVIRQKPLDLTGCTARLYTKKPDGNATFIDGTIAADGADGKPNTVTFVLTQQTTAAAGNAHCTVAVFGSNGTELKATGITLDIAADDMEQTIVSTSEFVSLAEALGSVQESEQKATQAVSESQKAVTDAQNAITEINNTEQSVKTAESSRMTAESQRVTAEQERVDAESARVTAEQARQTAESGRQTAETARESASQTAVNSAGAATTRANTAAKAAEDMVAGDIGTAVDQRITAKTDVASGIAGYDSMQTALAGKANKTDIPTTAAQVGARPSTWMPSAAEVGAANSALSNVDNTTFKSKAESAGVGANVDLSGYQLKSENPTAGQKVGTTLGSYAVYLGYTSTASGDTSIASGYYSTASGYCSTASGDGSIASGSRSTASGAGSTALGWNPTASGYYSMASGYYSTAHDESEFSMGEYNKKSTGSPSAFSTANNALTIGNGTSNSACSNCFRVDFSGNAYGLSSYHSSGADYSEYFEWQDENPNKEDRVGRLVTLDDEKIRYAKPDDDILGIVSALPAIIGDSPADSWKERYVTDVFGRRILEEVTVPEELEVKDKDGHVTKPANPEHTETRFKVNPNYDATKENEYENREKRPEWSTVGMLGKLVLIDDGTCVINGYCQPSTVGDGTATASTGKTNCRVMARLDSTHIKVLLK